MRLLYHLAGRLSHRGAERRRALRVPNWYNSTHSGRRWLTVWQPDIDNVRHRERLALLVDPGSLQEFGKLEGAASYDEDGRLSAVTSAARVTGLCRINGRRTTLHWPGHAWWHSGQGGCE